MQRGCEEAYPAERLVPEPSTLFNPVLQALKTGPPWKPLQAGGKRRWLQNTRLRRAAGLPSDLPRTFDAVVALEAVCKQHQLSSSSRPEILGDIVKLTEHGQASYRRKLLYFTGKLSRRKAIQEVLCVDPQIRRVAPGNAFLGLKVLVGCRGASLNSGGATRHKEPPST